MSGEHLQASRHAVSVSHYAVMSFYASLTPTVIGRSAYIQAHTHTQTDRQTHRHIGHLARLYTVRPHSWER